MYVHFRDPSKLTQKRKIQDGNMDRGKEQLTKATHKNEFSKLQPAGHNMVWGIAKTPDVK